MNIVLNSASERLPGTKHLNLELVISSPEGRARTVELNESSIALGRSAENQLAYPDDPWLSRFHLLFEQLNGVWIVRDCGSRNGTILNAALLNGIHKLQPGDRIQAGNLTIQVRIAPEQERIVSFVPDEAESSVRDLTVVTSLDRVLSQTSEEVESDSSLSSSRAVHALLRAGQELAGKRPIEELFGLILDLALSAVDARRGIILTLETGELTVKASRGQAFTISTAVRDRVLRERCSLMIEDALSDNSLRSQHSIVAQRVRSILAVPLQTGAQAIGLLYIDNGNILKPFDQEDLELLTVMANVAAIRIEHARLAEIEQQEKLTTYELLQAKEIQKSLLPAHAPSVQRTEIAGFNVPCRTVGGDYYDFLPYHDGRLGLVIGDVSGKGLPAAIMMSSLQARVQMLAESQPDPASAMSILNRNLCERCPPGKFITLFYALMDPGTGTLYYCNAGHNYPLVLRATGETEMLEGSDMVLGIMPAVHYQLRQTKLNEGDLLALYSDGVTEARDAASAEFGEDGLSRFMFTNREKTAGQMIDELQSAVRQWTDKESFADDFTVIFVRRS